MPGVRLRDNYFLVPSIHKSVNLTLGTNVAGTLWTPASGKKFRLMGGNLQSWVSVALDGVEAPGASLTVYDGAVSVPVVNLGVVAEVDLVAGSIIGTGVQDATTFASGVTAFNTANTLYPQEFAIPGGYLSATADNALKVNLLGVDGAADTIGTGGKIRIVGMVWGHEEP